MLKDFLYGVTVDPDGEDFQATYHVWTIPGLGKEIAPSPSLENRGNFRLSIVAGAGIEPATYSL